MSHPSEGSSTVLGRMELQTNGDTAARNRGLGEGGEEGEGLPRASVQAGRWQEDPQGR